MVQMPFPIYLLVPGGMFIFLIGLYSYIKKRKKETLIFFLLTTAQALWSFGTFLMWENCGCDQKVIFWDRLLYLPAVFMPALVYHFSLEVCRIQEKKQRFLLYLSYLIGIFLAVLTRTDYFVRDVFYYKWGCHTVAQIGHHLFPLSILIFTPLAAYNFFQTWRNKKETPLRRTQSFYILVGFFVFALAGFQLLPAYKIGIYPIFYLSLPIFALIIAYTITQRRLFIKVLATNILIAIILIFLLTFLIIPEIELTFLLKLSFFLSIVVLSVLLFKYTNQEVKRREEAERLVTEFKHLNEAKDQFIMATQHHMRTPLTIMKGYVSMLLEGDYGKINKEARKRLVFLQQSIEKLITLVNEFLDISQFQIGKGVLNLEEVKVEDLIREIIKELKWEAEDKGLYIKMKKLKISPVVKADRSKLKEAIYNIIDNGIKYTKKGGITISLKIENYKLKIAIHDTGIGMTKEEIKTLFSETFERGKEAKKVYALGRGIGLYIASNIIKAHRGKIWAESPGEGKGSTFYIELPVK